MVLALTNRRYFLLLVYILLLFLVHAFLQQTILHIGRHGVHAHLSGATYTQKPLVWIFTSLSRKAYQQ